jgi:hypothetical protein
MLHCERCCVNSSSFTFTLHKPDHWESVVVTSVTGGKHSLAPVEYLMAPTSRVVRVTPCCPSEVSLRQVVGRLIKFIFRIRCLETLGAAVKKFCNPVRRAHASWLNSSCTSMFMFLSDSVRLYVALCCLGHGIERSGSERQLGRYFKTFFLPMTQLKWIFISCRSEVNSVYWPEVNLRGIFRIKHPKRSTIRIYILYKKTPWFRITTTSATMMKFKTLYIGFSDIGVFPVLLAWRSSSSLYNWSQMVMGVYTL